MIQKYINNNSLNKFFKTMIFEKQYIKKLKNKIL